MRIRTFTLLIVLITFISFLFYIPTNVEAAAKIPKGSMIANVSLAEKTKSEAKQLLETELAIWQAGDDLILKSQFERIEIPRTALEFDIDATIKQLNERTKRTLTSLFMRQKNVHLPIVVKINEEHEAIKSLRELGHINADETLTNLINLANQLDQSDIKLIYIEGKEVPLDVIAEVELEIPEDLSNAVLTYGIDELHEFIIDPNDHFSLLQTIEFPKSLTNSTEEISFIGTALYSLFLQTNFDIVERHAQLTEAVYAEPGLDVAINEKENEDLIVSNPNDASYIIEAERRDDILHVRLKSSQTDLTYTYEFAEIKKINQRTLFRYSKKLKAGDRQTIQAGSKGLTVEVHRSTYEDGVLIDSELISKDIYLPVPTIMLVSTEDEVPEEDLIDDFIGDSTGDMEEIKDSIEKLEETVNVIESITTPDLSVVDPDSLTISEQLLKVKQAQALLEEKIAMIESGITLSEKKMEKYQEDISFELGELKEQMDKLLEYFLNEDDEEEMDQ